MMDDDSLDGWDPFDPLQDQFEKTMGAMGRIDHALSLLLNHFKAEGYTTADVIGMCRVVLEEWECREPWS